MYQNLVKSYEDPKEGLRRFTQAYLACVSAVDDNIGQVVNAIDNSKFKDNTIIVLVSDHGWTMGEKDHIYKNSLWEESTRIPMTIRVPGITKPKSKVDHPVSLIDIYPTCIDYGKLEPSHDLDGFSLRPFLENPELAEWSGPDFSLAACGSRLSSELNQPAPASNQHFSIRTERYRYIRCRNGEEELYDHSKICPRPPPPPHPQ